MKNRVEKGTYRFQFYLFLSLSFFISLLPRKIMVKVGRGFGALSYLIWIMRDVG